MKRIIWMVLMNLWYVPYGIYHLLRMSSHPERYSLEERFAMIKKIDNRAIKGGRVEIEGHGLSNLPEKNGYILYPNHQGMFDVLAVDTRSRCYDDKTSFSGAEKRTGRDSVFEAGICMHRSDCARPR